MKRRDFIKVSAVAGVAGSVLNSYASSFASKFAGEGFDLHPFIKAHPEAVFINLTDIKEKTDSKAKYDASYKLASEMFVKTQNGQGYSNSTKIIGKPNWTTWGRIDPNDPTYHMGIITDLDFIAGYLNGVRDKGPQDFYLRECAAPNLWEELGYYKMANDNNFNLKDLSLKDYWELGDEIIFKEVSNGVVFKEIGYMAPVNTPDTYIVNMAKFKAHAMGITGVIKNLQGVTGRVFHRFCNASNFFLTIDERYHRFFQPDYVDRIAELHKKHLEAGIPRWNSVALQASYTGLNMERWSNRMLDSFSVTTRETSGIIHIVEGIYGRDGNGFTLGPWEENGKQDRAKDYMSNNILFGLDAFRVDIIMHWLAGHEPGNFGLFHIGIERGLSDVLDPFDIPVYLWENGVATKVSLDTFKRTPLLTQYLPLEGENRYHMCNEPFDYKSWKTTGKIAKNEASIRALGTDSKGHIVMDMKVPQKGNVFIEIVDSNGELLHRMHADHLEPGVHQVVWDGFAAPGIYTTYVKGMEWDVENEMVIYT